MDEQLTPAPRAAAPAGARQATGGTHALPPVSHHPNGRIVPLAVRPSWAERLAQPAASSGEDGETVTYDAQSYALAEHFLADQPPEKRTEAVKRKLAEAIQSTVEDFLTDLEEGLIGL
jgi:hypothetical protein